MPRLRTKGTGQVVRFRIATPEEAVKRPGLDTTTYNIDRGGMILGDAAASYAMLHFGAKLEVMPAKK